MTENSSSNHNGQRGLTHDNVHRKICKDDKEHVERRLRRLISDRCYRVVLTSFKEAYERANVHVYNLFCMLMKQIAVKYSFTRENDKLPGTNMQKLAASQNFSQNLAPNLIISFTVLVLVSPFINQEAPKPPVMKQNSDKTRFGTCHQVRNNATVAVAWSSPG